MTGRKLLLDQGGILGKYLEVIKVLDILWSCV